MKNSKFLREEEKHHDEMAEEYAKRRETDFIWEVPEQMFLLKKEYFQPHSIVIDMGCGPSTPVWHTFSIQTLSSFTYIGVDISREMLRIAKKYIPSGKFVHGDVETVRFSKNSADTILSLGTLHHSLDKKNTFFHWYEILKKDGFMLLREPTFESLKHGEGESPHEEGIKVDELLQLAVEKKMRILKVIYFNTYFFHLFNRIMIRLGWKNWEGRKPLDRIIVNLDILLGKTIKSIFRGSDVIIILQKL